MPNLPERANSDHLRKQAKAPLRVGRAGEAEAIAHFRRRLPAAVKRLEAGALRRHDAQS